MATRYPSRDDDANVLAMARLRFAGKSTRQIAERLGVSQQVVSFHTCQVKNADLALAWDSPAAIRAGYWQ